MRRGAIALLAGALVWSACGDDGNDGELLARQAQRRAAELRADATADAPSGPSTSEPTTREATGQGGSTVPSTAATTVATVEPTGVVVPVIALDNSFRPEVVEIAVGDEVLWENRGINDHDVLYVDGDDWGIEVEGFAPGAAYARVFTEPGRYDYYCSIHGNETVGMTGTIIVTD